MWVTLPVGVQRVWGMLRSLSSPAVRSWRMLFSGPVCFWLVWQALVSYQMWKFFSAWIIYLSVYVFYQESIYWVLDTHLQGTPGGAVAVSSVTRVCDSRPPPPSLSAFTSDLKSWEIKCNLFLLPSPAFKSVSNMWQKMSQADLAECMSLWIYFSFHTLILISNHKNY